jgi:transcriptional regulator with XRE-family HTH domain
MGRPSVITGRTEKQLAAMRDAGVSQERCAIACNVGRRTVQRWEARQRRDETQTFEESLAAALNAVPSFEEVLAGAGRARPPARRSRRAPEGDWRAAAAALEQLAPERWGPPPGQTS